MKAIVHVSPNITIEVEEAKQKDLFKAIASAHEVFGEEKCGLCGSTDIRPVWRVVTQVQGKKIDTYEFPEWQCEKCLAKLAMGTINDDTGTLFPQRKLMDGGSRLPTKDEKEAGLGEYGKHNGWHKYNKREQK